MERRWKILLVVSVGAFMAFLDAPVVSIAFPALQETFRATPATTLGWTIDAYFIGFAAVLVVGGKLSDRYGRRRVFMTGMWLFLGASLVCGLAPTAGVLIAARAAQAVAAALVVPSGQALMLIEFEPHERRKAIGILAGLVAVATSLAPTVGAVIVEGPGWRWIFYLNVFVGAGVIAWAARLMHRDRPDAGAPTPDALGSVIEAAALSFLVLGILKSQQWGLGDPRTLAALAAGVAGFALFIDRCRRHRAPVLDLRMFRNRPFTVANLSSIAFAIALYAGTINSVLYLTSVWGLSILTTGLIFAPAALVSVVVGGVMGRLADRYDPRPITAGGALVAAIGLVLIATSTGLQEDYVGGWLPGQVVYTVGIVTGLTGVIGTALTSVPTAQLALASGINAAMRQVGGAVGVAFTLAILGDSFGAEAMRRGHTVFLIGAGALLVAGFVALFMQPVPVAATEPGLVPSPAEELPNAGG